VAGQKPF